jgi:serine/threonine protein kinase
MPPLQSDSSGGFPRQSDTENSVEAGEGIIRARNRGHGSFATPAPIRADLIPGYRLVRQLGQGASATVYLAEDPAGATVAVKLLSAVYLDHAEVRQRWEREARMLERLSHPRIVRGLSHGEAEGRPYFIMEHIRGETLTARLARLGPMNEAEARRIARDMLSALAAAHAVGLVHRDVKPSNMIMNEAGDTLLMDFGLARHVDDPMLTMHGAILGTPAYVSPEQARGDQNVDIRSDLYSLGISLYQLLTGDVPFSTLNTSLLLTRKVTDDVPDVRRARPGVSAAFAAMVAKLCARDRERRPTAPKDALAILDRIDLSGECDTDHSASDAPPPDQRVDVTQTAVPMLGAVAPAVLQTVMDDSQLSHAPVRLKSGEILFYEDDEGHDCYLLLNGEVEVLRAGRQVATIGEPGSFLGEMSILRKAPRSATVRVTRDATLLRIGEDELHQFLKRHPETNYQLACVLAERLDETTRRLSEAQARLVRLQRLMREMRTNLEF